MELNKDMTLIVSMKLIAQTIVEYLRALMYCFLSAAFAKNLDEALASEEKFAFEGFEMQTLGKIPQKSRISVYTPKNNKISPNRTRFKMDSAGLASKVQGASQCRR